MELEKYKALWKHVNAPMLELMERLQVVLQEGPGDYISRFNIQAPTLETDAEDFFVSLIIADATGDKLPLVAVNFKLFDDEAGAGANVGFQVDDIPGQENVWGYLPYNYTEDCYTTDEAELLRRVNELPLVSMMEFMRSYLENLAAKKA